MKAGRMGIGKEMQMKEQVEVRAVSLVFIWGGLGWLARSLYIFHVFVLMFVLFLANVSRVVPRMPQTSK